MIMSLQEPICREVRYCGMMLSPQRMYPDLSGPSCLLWETGLDTHSILLYQEVNCRKRVSIDRNQKINAKGIMLIFFLGKPSQNMGLVSQGVLDEVLDGFI